MPERRATHIPALDGVRGLAILLVMQTHFFPVLGFRRWVGGSVITPWLSNLSMLGGTGVDLFFVLSGFLITGILLRSKRTRRDFLGFYWRRTLRIFPLYYATLLALYFLFAPRGGEHAYLTRLPWLASYTTNILIALRHAWSFNVIGMSLDHFWSLAVEEQFYLIWPALVFACSRAWLARISWAFIGLAFLGRSYFVLSGNQYGAMTLLPCRIDALAIGALLALAFEDGEPAFARVMQQTPRLLLLGGAVVALSCIDPRALVVFGFLGCGVLYAGVMLLALQPRARGFFENAALRSIGKYSYAIYVLHPILSPWFHAYLAPTLLGPIPFALLEMAAAYLAGVVSWHVFEKHFMRLRPQADGGAALSEK